MQLINIKNGWEYSPEFRLGDKDCHYSVVNYISNMWLACRFIVLVGNDTLNLFKTRFNEQITNEV